MTSITLTLDHHDFYHAVRGFAHGSHLCQHVWRSIVFPAIRQMDDEFLDFMWFVMRRDLFADYFDEEGRGRCCGHADFLHCLAALNRCNRYMVRFVSRDTADEDVHEVVCYRFAGSFRPVHSGMGDQHEFGYYSFIPDEWLEGSEWIGCTAVIKYADEKMRALFEELDIYDLYDEEENIIMKNKQ